MTVVGDALCRLGLHDRRVVRWVERGMVRRGPGTAPVPYEVTLSGYRCRRCEPVADVTNDPLILPGPPGPRPAGA